MVVLVIKELDASQKLMVFTFEVLLLLAASRPCSSVLSGVGLLSLQQLSSHLPVKDGLRRSVCIRIRVTVNEVTLCLHKAPTEAIAPTWSFVFH